ncbi:MAG: hypothetical protein M1828_004645 [Chrysothrix sp. TS-e1954]|nr:MAG: hypothetical protein M1828_004645 [Chrysothrix sp. TS-e1954]
MVDETREGNVSSQFVSENAGVEDIAQSKTAGLYNLSDYRKKRVEALEEKGREALENGTSPLNSSRSSTPGTPQPQPKKRKRTAAQSKLSFGGDDADEESNPASAGSGASQSIASASKSTGGLEKQDVLSKKRMGPNGSIGHAPKVMTKGAIARDAETRERLRKDFLLKQEAVKSTEILVPFVFYDGTNIPGGVCKMKKGDPMWLFLDRSRKVGAELGVGGADKSKREWARVGVDDLMLVRGDIIIPHHYDFYYFISGAMQGFQGPLFRYTSHVEPPVEVSKVARSAGEDIPVKKVPKTTKLEGFDHDATQTKVVDRRWYEKHKHIYPASIWEEFDPNKDYTSGIRKDPKGNAFFFR